MKPLQKTIALLFLSLFLSACTLQESQTAIEIPCADFYENPHITNSVEVELGDEFTVSLCSNPSTGFQWIEMADISDPGVLEQVSHEYGGPSENGAPPPPGTPGIQIWRFKTLKEGTSILSFEYSRDWEGGEKGTWTFVLEVNVK
jgi:predicted secreted protein